MIRRKHIAYRCAGIGKLTKSWIFFNLIWLAEGRGGYFYSYVIFGFKIFFSWILIEYFLVVKAGKNPLVFRWHLIFLSLKASHCTFPSNLFHGQITHICIDQLSPPENKKCSYWKVFRIKPPSNPLLLSKRGLRDPDAWLPRH